MLFRSLVATGVLLSFSAAKAAEPAAGSQDEKESVRNGLAFVEGKSLTWLRERKCASCHHVPMMVWAQRDARERGFAIDEMGLQEATEFLLAADNRAGIVPNAGEGDRPGNPFSLMATFTILAFRDGGKGPEPAAKELLEKAAAHVLARQEADGSWKRFEGRPPIMDLQEPATLLAAHALGPEPAGSAAAESGRTKIRQWLIANSKAEQTQSLNLRILIDHERRASVDELLKRQNADGSWSQISGMPGDGFATGQALYALLSRGGVERSHAAIVKARDFLVTTQQPDGSWKMTSRPATAAPEKPGAGNLEPISVAGSAWAVLGLLQLTPAVSP